MRVLPFVALILIAASASAPAEAQSATGCTRPRVACALFDTYLAAFNHRDWNAFRATLSDDVTVMFDFPPQPERRDGRVAVEEFFRRVFPPEGTPPSQLPPPVQPDQLLAQDLGDALVVSFHIRTPEELGRRTVVLHKTAAGWRVVHIHGSSFAIRAR